MKRTCKPTIAGVINIISGVFFLMGGITIISLIGQPVAESAYGYVIYSMELSGTPGTPTISTIIIMISSALIMLGMLSLLGGIYSMNRNVWGLAMAGSVATFVSTLLLGVPTIILTAISRKEFS